MCKICVPYVKSKIASSYIETLKLTGERQSYKFRGIGHIYRERSEYILSQQCSLNAICILTICSCKVIQLRIRTFSCSLSRETGVLSVFICVPLLAGFIATNFIDLNRSSTFCATAFCLLCRSSSPRSCFSYSFYSF